MKIFVNAEPVSFSLEKEETLFDIYTALCAWAREQGGIIAGLEVNGEPKDPGLCSQWGDMPLQSLQTIGVTVREKGHELEVIRDYFEILRAALAAGNEKALRECLVEYPYIRRALEIHLRDIFSGSGENFRLDEALRTPKNEGEAFGQAEKQAIESYVQAVSRVVEDRFREIEQPEKEAAAVARLLATAKPALENVPVLLQTGKDREAMQCILSFTGLALKAIRILSNREKGQENSREFCREFNGILNELTAAFEIRDSVLIGDLFEYEIAPRTDRLAELLAGG
jgi:hypothetical protein